MDVFSFSGQQNHKLIIRMRTMSGALDPRLELFRSQRQPRHYSGRSEYATIVDFTLPSTGTYLLHASDADGDETGNYWLTLQCRQCISPDTIQCDDSLTAVISPIGDMDKYIFTGNLGNKVTIRMHGISGSLDPKLELSDPNGNLVANVEDNSEAAITDFVLPAQGALHSVRERCRRRRCWQLLAHLSRHPTFIAASPECPSHGQPL